MKHNLLVLFIGDHDRGSALSAVIESKGGYAYLPKTMMEALGMYITYFPDVIVMDPSADYALETFRHLESVDAGPIVLLGEDPTFTAERWNTYVLPRGLDSKALATSLSQLVDSARLLNTKTFSAAPHLI